MIFILQFTLIIVLAEEDIRGSIAHAKMLGETGIISSVESETIVTGLKKIFRKKSDPDRSLGNQVLKIFI